MFRDERFSIASLSDVTAQTMLFLESPVNVPDHNVRFINV